MLFPNEHIINLGDTVKVSVYGVTGKLSTELQIVQQLKVNKKSIILNNRKYTIVQNAMGKYHLVSKTKGDPYSFVITFATDEDITSIKMKENLKSLKSVLTDIQNTLSIISQKEDSEFCQDDLMFFSAILDSSNETKRKLHHYSSSK